jgi:hypothetical protein
MMKTQTMIEPSAWAKITTYIAERKLETALEAALEQNVVDETTAENNGNLLPNEQRLDCIYDDEPLGFEKDPVNSNPKMQAQDPLQEIDIGWPH